MALAIIVNQAGKPAGEAGFAREDMVTGVAANLSITDGPYAQVKWTTIDAPDDLSIPAKSSAALSASTSPTTNLSPLDNAGTYFVQVAVDAGFGLGARPEDVARITFYAGPALSATWNHFPRRVPAFQETTEHNVKANPFPAGNPKGWSTELRRWLGASAALAVGSSIQVFYNNAPLGGGTFQYLDFVDPIAATDLGSGVAGFIVLDATAGRLGAVQLVGDLTGVTGGNPLVAGITGTGLHGSAPIHCDELIWDANIEEPSLIQEQAAGTAAGTAMFIGAQDAGPSAPTNTKGGNLVLAAGKDNGVTFAGGTQHAAVIFQSAGANLAGVYKDSSANIVLHMDISNSGAPGYIIGPTNNALLVKVPTNGTFHMIAASGITMEDDTSAGLIFTPSHNANNLITFAAAGSIEITKASSGIGSARFRMNATQIGFFDNAPASRPAAYTITNHTDRRTMDETAITLVQLANLVGTFMHDFGAGLNATGGYGLFL